MFVARIGHLQRITANPYLKNEVDNVVGRHVVGVWTVPAAPAYVITAQPFRNALQRAIERCDLLLGPGVIIREVRRWHHHVIFGGKPRVVELNDQAGIGDRLVLGAQPFTQRRTQLFLGAVIFIPQTLQYARRSDDWQKTLHIRMIDKRRLEIGDISLHLVMALIFDRSRDHPVAAAGISLLPALILGVEFPEAVEIGSGRWRWPRALTRYGAKFETVEPLGDVAIPGAFRILAVIDDR